MAFNAGAIVSKLTLDKSKFSAAVRSVKKETSAMGGWVQKNSAQFQKLGKFTKIAGLAIVGTLAMVVKKASDAEETAAKFGTVFQSVMDDANVALAKLRKNYGLSNVAAQDMLSSTGDLLTGLGMEAEAALKLSERTQQLAVDLASFTNYSGGAKGASMALTKAMLGERESVKMLGIVITEEMVKERLLREGKEDLTGQALLQAKAEAALAIAVEQSKNAIGDYERTSTSLANTTRRLMARLNDLFVALGEKLVPIFAYLANKVTDALENVQSNTSSFTDNMLRFFKILAAGVQGLGLAWSGFKALVFTIAEYAGKIMKAQIDIMTAPLKLLAKIPGKLGEPARLMLAEVGKLTGNLTIITDSYNQSAGEQVDVMADIRQQYEEFVKLLEKVGGGLTKLETKSKKTTKKTAEDFANLGSSIDLGPAFTKVGMSLDEFKEYYKEWLTDLYDSWERKWGEMLNWSRYFTSQLSAIFNQLFTNRMQQIENEYEAQKASIESSTMSERQKAAAIESLDKRTDKERKKALRSQAKATKLVALMEAIVNTAAAVAEALPNIPLAILVGALGAIQVGTIAAQPLPSFKEGGDVPEDTVAHLHRGEHVLSAEDVRRGGTGPNLYMTIAPVFHTEATDEYAVQRFIEQKGAPALLEMLKNGIMLPEFQKILGTR